MLNFFPQETSSTHRMECLWTFSPDSLPVALKLEDEEVGQEQREEEGTAAGEEEGHLEATAEDAEEGEASTSGKKKKKKDKCCNLCPEIFMR